MTTTYLLLSIAVVVPVVAVSLIVLLRPRHVLAAVGIALVVLVVLTTVFDTVIVGSGIVAYDARRILGWRVGVAPIEDFSYPVAAVFALPALWLVVPGRRLPASSADGRAGTGH